MDESLLDLVLGVLVDELLVVGDNRLGDGLADGVDLGNVTTTGDADTDVDSSEFVKTDDQEGFVDLDKMMSSYEILVLGFSFFLYFDLTLVQDNPYLVAELLGLDEVEGLAVDLDEAFALL